MKKVRVTYEAIVDDSKLKNEDDVIEEGYEDIEDAILSDGLEGVIRGSYEYRIDWEISDAEDNDLA